MEHQTLHTDTNLLQQVASGDETAFAALVHRYWKNVYSQALSYLASRQVAEELTQDVFIKVWRVRTELPDIRNIEGYIYTVCRNTVLNALRKELRTPLAAMPVDTVDQLLQPDKQLEYQEYYKQLMDLIEQLPEKRKLVFKMSRLEGRSHQEIATQLGMHEVTVAQYIMKAVNFLKTHLLSTGGDLLLIYLLLDIVS